MVVDRIRERGHYGINSRAVTVHPVSQKTLLKLGGKETGVLVGAIPTTTTYRDFKAQNTRQSGVLFYTKVLPEPERPAYLPARHADIMRRIYAHVGLVRTFPEANSGALKDLPAASRIDAKIAPSAQRCELTVGTLGADLAAQLRVRVRELCEAKLENIFLDLPLTQPATALVVPEIEALGFFFAGIAPEAANGDILRYQYLNHVQFDPAQVNLVTDFGKELFAYVLSCRPTT